MTKFAEHTVPAPTTTAQSSTAADNTNTRDPGMAAAMLRATKDAIVKMTGKFRCLGSGIWSPPIESLDAGITPVSNPDHQQSETAEGDLAPTGINLTQDSEYVNGVEQIVPTETSSIPQDAAEQLGPLMGPMGAPLSLFDPRHYGCKDDSTMIGGNSAGLVRMEPKAIAIRTPHNGEVVFTRATTKQGLIFLFWVKDPATGEIHPIFNKLIPDLVSEGKIKLAEGLMAPTMSADGSFFLWPVNYHPGSWSASGLDAVYTASDEWFRVGVHQNCYTVTTPEVSPAEPVWPSMTVTEVLEAAFGGRCIYSLNDPLLKKLQKNHKTK